MKDVNKIDSTFLNEVDSIEWSEKVAKFLKESREKMNYSQTDLATILGINRQTVSKWERNGGLPAIDMLIPLCKALDISVYSLLLGKTMPKNYEPKDIRDIKIFGKVIIRVHKTTKKLLSIFSIIFFSLISIFSIILFLFHFYKWNLYYFVSLNTDFFVNAQVVTNRKESIYNINDISYNSDFIGTEDEPIVVQMEAKLIIDGKEVNSYFSTYEEPVPLHSVVDQISIYFNANKDTAYTLNRDINITLNYFNQDEDERNIVIKLAKK